VRESVLDPSIQKSERGEDMKDLSGDFLSRHVGVDNIRRA